MLYCSCARIRLPDAALANDNINTRTTFISLLLKVSRVGNLKEQSNGERNRKQKKENKAGEKERRRERKNRRCCWYLRRVSSPLNDLMALLRQYTLPWQNALAIPLSSRTFDTLCNILSHWENTIIRVVGSYLYIRSSTREDVRM